MEEQQPQLTYQQRLAEIKNGLRKKETGPKPKKPLRTKSLKKLSEEKEAKEKPESDKEKLNQWFDAVMIRHTPNGFGICMECGSKIPMEYMRHATAHLLEKRHFKSVATSDNNYMILCAGNGCHGKTHTVQKIITLKVWPQIKEKINSMLPLLPYDELKYVSQQLYNALENY